MQKTPNKNLQDLFKTYVAKSGDEEKFRKAHVTTVVDNNDEKLGPKEDQFVATTKTYERDATHHGYDVGGDEKVYSEEVESIEEALAAKDRYDHHHNHAKALLKSIGEHLDREGKEARSAVDYRGNKGPNWGHVGSMEHVAKQLGDIHDMLARQGEYAQSSKIAEEVELDEKKLTPAEMKKREEVAQAIERENPDMPMSKKMAIATAQAKKVAEEIELGESVMSDDAFDRLEKAGAKDCKTTSGGINYTAGGKEYKLRHDMKRSGHRTVRTAELEKHLDRLKALAESTEEADSLYLKEGSFKAKMLNKGIGSLQSMLAEDSDVDE